MVMARRSFRPRKPQVVVHMFNCVSRLYLSYNLWITGSREGGGGNQDKHQDEDKVIPEKYIWAPNLGSPGFIYFLGIRRLN